MQITASIQTRAETRCPVKSQGPGNVNRESGNGDPRAGGAENEKRATRNGPLFGESLLSAALWALFALCFLLGIAFVVCSLTFAMLRWVFWLPLRLCRVMGDR